MLDWLAAQMQSRPSGIALIAENKAWTYTALNDSVSQMTGALRQNGVQRGDFVAALLPNQAEYVFLVHAVARLGAVLVPLNTRLTSAELGYPLQVVNARWLVVCESTRGAAEGAAKTSDGVTLLDITALTKSDVEPVLSGEIALDDLQAVVFTSGTTGKPKGASISFGNQFWGAMGSAYRLGTLPEDRWLCCLSLFHVGGLAIIERCCLYGTTVVLQQGVNLEAIQQAMIAHQVTLISVVPTMLHRMLANPDSVNVLQKARLVLIGGAASSPELIEHCAALGIPAAPTYGLSEACSQVATLLPTEAIRKPGCTGKPLLFSQVEVINEHGDPVPPGTYGEVVVSGRTVMSGYYHNPEATAKTLHDGRLFTGDIGYLDSDGDLWLVQRRSDLIVSGGENVYPVEVEQALLKHPAVDSACVVGIPNPEWGQVVAAEIVLKPNMALTAEELITFSRKILAGYKQPRLIQFVDQLPMTGSGKVERRTVGEQLKAYAEHQR